MGSCKLSTAWAHNLMVRLPRKVAASVALQHAMRGRCLLQLAHLHNGTPAPCRAAQHLLGLCTPNPTCLSSLTCLMVQLVKAGRQTWVPMLEEVGAGPLVVWHVRHSRGAAYWWQPAALQLAWAQHRTFSAGRAAGSATHCVAAQLDLRASPQPFKVRTLRHNPTQTDVGRPVRIDAGSGMQPTCAHSLDQGT